MRERDDMDTDGPAPLVGRTVAIESSEEEGPTAEEARAAPALSPERFKELQDKEAKVDTAAKLWVPAVNAEVTFGRWDFLEITDPWNAQTLIRRYLARSPSSKG